jgi:uncharacterized membrane protein
MQIADIDIFTKAEEVAVAQAEMKMIRNGMFNIFFDRAEKRTVLCRNLTRRSQRHYQDLHDL